MIDQSTQIMIETPGKTGRPMTMPEIVKTLSQQQEYIKLLTAKVKYLESQISESKIAHTQP